MPSPLSSGRHSQSLCLCLSVFALSLSNITIFFLKKARVCAGGRERASATASQGGSTLAERSRVQGRGGLGHGSPRPCSAGVLLFLESLEAGPEVRTTGFCRLWPLARALKKGGQVSLGRREGVRPLCTQRAVRPSVGILPAAQTTGDPLLPHCSPPHCQLSLAWAVKASEDPRFPVSVTLGLSAGSWGRSSWRARAAFPRSPCSLAVRAAPVPAGQAGNKGMSCRLCAGTSP